MRNATDKDPSIYILLIILLKIYTKKKLLKTRAIGGRHEGKSFFSQSTRFWNKHHKGIIELSEVELHIDVSVKLNLVGTKFAFFDFSTKVSTLKSKPSVTSLDLNCFLEHRSGCLINELGRYMSPDPFHLGRDGYRLLANIFKNMILGSNHRSGRRDSQSGIRPDSSSSRRSHPVTSRHSHSSQYSYS